ncbi:MAG: M48 family metalloprotease [Desulfobulbaceae bacterium]
MKKTFSRRDLLECSARLGLAGATATVLSSFLNGCLAPTDVTSTLAQVAQYSDSAVKVAKAGVKAFDEFTPEQEYYIGRTVGAMVLQKYKPYGNKQLLRYINILGQTLARASDLPETFNGYHMLVLDSNDINAFATPGGHIFVTRGILRCCANEGELAAILAHEVGHVQLKHGLQAIKKSRYAEFGTLLAMETTRMSSAELAKLVGRFEDTISDITTTMINNGYSRAFEEDADKSAVTIMRRVGYDPRSLVTMLETMKGKIDPGGLDFAKTHPSPAKRIDYLADIAGKSGRPSFSKEQETRFQGAMKHV